MGKAVPVTSCRLPGLPRLVHLRVPTGEIITNRPGACKHRPSKIAVLCEFRLGNVLAQPNRAPGKPEEDQAPDGDAEHVRGHPGVLLLRVEEVVRVKAFCGLNHVRQREVKGQDEDEPEHVQGGRGVGPGNDHLKEGEHAVEQVLRDVAPCLEDDGVPGSRVKTGPKSITVLIKR